MPKDKILFITTVRALNKIEGQLTLSMTTTGVQIILGSTNQKLLKEAREKLREASALLNQIK